MTAGWVVYELGERPRTAGPTGAAAIATAETLSVMPLRARVASATADDLDHLELPAVALGLEGEDAPRWWRA